MHHIDKVDYRRQENSVQSMLVKFLQPFVASKISIRKDNIFLFLSKHECALQGVPSFSSKIKNCSGSVFNMNFSHTSFY